jgi:hypothetical protein
MTRLAIIAFIEAFHTLQGNLFRAFWRAFSNFRWGERSREPKGRDIPPGCPPPTNGRMRPCVPTKDSARQEPRPTKPYRYRMLKLIYFAHR